MYTYTEIGYTCNPPSCGGNHEAGQEISSWMSPSPKAACAREGHPHFRQVGVVGVPVMGRRILTAPNGTVIFDEWD